jgi:hypothetical protein
VRKEETHTCGPDSENSCPIRLSAKQMFREGLILPNECIASAKILWVIMVIISLIHQSEKLFEVDKQIKQDLLPNGLWERGTNRLERIEPY